MIHREINVKIKSFYPLNDEFNNPVKSPSWGITYQQNSLFLSHFAGTPLTVTPAETSRVTTAPAPTMALSPIVTPGKINAPIPINEINNKVRWTIAMDVVSRFSLPFATQTKSPYQFWIDEYRRMREEDPLNASENFYKKYGDEYYYFTTSLSKNYTGIAATVEADKRAKKLSDLIAENPEYGWFLVGDANAGDFSPTVYRKQQKQTVAPGSTISFRGQQDPFEAIKETNAERGWIEYNKGLDKIEAERINRGLKSLESKGAEDLKQMKADFTAYLAERNPDWDSARGKIDTRKVINFLKFADKSAKDPRLSERNDMKTMSEYIKGRDYIMNLLAQRESKNIDNENNADLKQMWAEFTGLLIDRDVTFNRIYTRILENDKLLERL